MSRARSSLVTRVLAAKSLNIPEVPTMVARGWTEAQITAYRVADNALNAGGGGWDEALLKVEIREVEALNYDVGKLGLDMEFMTKLFDEGGVNIAADRDEAGTGVRAASEVWFEKHRHLGRRAGRP